MVGRLGGGWMAWLIGGVSCGTLVGVFVRVGGGPVFLFFGTAVVICFFFSDITPARSGVLPKYLYNNNGSINCRIRYQSS